jgi:hypothetical protein
VIAIMEIENDGYGAASAIQDLVDHLNAAAGAGTYAFINPDTANGSNSLGVDAIKVGIIYKPAAVMPVGATAVLNSTAFVNGGDSAARNRPALAQAFEENGTAERFIVVANHFKSKGSACDAADAGDGQGNCNIVRTNAANTLTTWLGTDPTDTGDPDILIMGDLNAYAKEDPITAIKTAGYANLIEDRLGTDAYSFAFNGQWGYLDHALGTSAINAQVVGVAEWHINADEPSALDYNTDYKSAGQIASLYAADQFRASDHDPVIVGLELFSADYSDSPGSYGSATHSGSSMLALGELKSSDGTPPGAGGDDGSDDGVVPMLPAWSTANDGQIRVTVTGGAGYVTGWIDWDQDGTFADPAERVFINEAFEDGETRPISFAIPDGTNIGAGSANAFYGRFRVYPTAQTLLAAAIPEGPSALPSPTGNAVGGEVEDYQFSFNPTAVTLSSLAAARGALPGWLLALIPLLGLAATPGLAWA